jgi:hypothetical protein
MIGSHNTGTFTPKTLRDAVIATTRKRNCVYIAGGTLSCIGLERGSEELRKWIASIPRISWHFWSPLRDELAICVDTPMGAEP